MAELIWISILVVLLVIEASTMGLYTIWFAGGALAAFLSTYIGAQWWVQLILFLIVSLVMLFFTRPIAVKYINSRRQKTNYEGLVGKVVVVNEKVDNYNSTGSAFINDTEWTVRSKDDEVVIESGTKVRITAIEGNKLIAESCE